MPPEAAKATQVRHGRQAYQALDRTYFQSMKRSINTPTTAPSPNTKKKKYNIWSSTPADCHS
ncbi:hypothetical protein K456DRAFT_58344 [Colletotrichum gloeosporioides 23]|nr:hypothetical protein K456DRAFT_58344 [Colletotrichum gloeosporioides 23]